MNIVDEAALQMYPEHIIVQYYHKQGFIDGYEKCKKDIIVILEKLIGAHKTKNGFPAGTLSAIKIEAYEKLLSILKEASTPAAISSK